MALRLTWQLTEILAVRPWLSKQIRKRLAQNGLKKK